MCLSNNPQSDIADAVYKITSECFHNIMNVFSWLLMSWKRLIWRKFFFIKLALKSTNGNLGPQTKLWPRLWRSFSPAHNLGDAIDYLPWYDDLVCRWERCHFVSKQQLHPQQLNRTWARRCCRNSPSFCRCELERSLHQHHAHLRDNHFTPVLPVTRLQNTVTLASVKHPLQVASWTTQQGKKTDFAFCKLTCL